MNLNLDNKVFIISGSSSGIGRGIAKGLLEEGAKVVLTGRKNLEKTFKTLSSAYPDRVISCGGDLNAPQTLEKMESEVIDKWSCIDGLVANAGAVKPVPDWNISDDDWDWYYEMNLKIATRFVTRFIPYLERTSGSIVFTGSIAGLEDIGAPLPYSASKIALTMYAKGLARQLSKQGIRVNTVAPGNIIFPGGNWDKKQQANPELIQKMLNDKVPMGRFGTPEDIANMVVFLLSEKANFITGSCFVVDGGQTNLVF